MGGAVCRGSRHSCAGQRRKREQFAFFSPVRAPALAATLQQWSDMKVRDIMKASPITATEITPLGEALQTMMKNRLRHLPIVRGDRLCGVLSERDILHYRAVTAFREDWWRAPTTSAMVATVQTAGPDDSLTEVAGRLADSRIGALPIVDAGKLIGIVTVIDVLEAEVRDSMA